VLEIGDADYTRKFGGKRVTHSDVLHVADRDPPATIVADLTAAEHIPSNAFDCAIVTQTLHLIYDVRAAIGTLYRILKPGGVLVVNSSLVPQKSERDDIRVFYVPASDLATELLVRYDGDEGLFRAYDMVEFLAPVKAGDFIEAVGRLVSVGNSSRKMEFEAYRVITRNIEAGESAADLLKKPVLVCRAKGTCVTPKDKQRIEHND